MGRTEGVTAGGRLFEVLVRQWRERGIAIAVINGFNPSTSTVGRDIDLLCRPEDLPEVIQVASAVADANGWNHVAGRWLRRWFPRGLYQLVFFKFEQETVVYLALDIICSTGIAAATVSMYDPDLVKSDLQFRSGIPFSPIAEYMKNYVIKDMAGVKTKVPHIDRLPPEVRQALVSTAGERFTSRYERSIQSNTLGQDWRSLRRALQIGFFLGQPLQSVVNLWKSACRRLLGQRTYTVAVVGPDGVGKTTVLEETSRYLNKAFVRIRRRHWRPRLLPELGRLLTLGPSETEGTRTSVAPRRTAGRFTLVRQVYYWCDYLLGHIAKDRWTVHPEFVVNLYDRCSLDMFVDPVRFGLRKSSGNYSIYRFSPKPDLVILLTDKPERIYERKQELSVDEIEDQMKIWNALTNRGVVNEVIDVSGRTPSAVGREIALYILSLICEADVD